MRSPQVRRVQWTRSQQEVTEKCVNLNLVGHEKKGGVVFRPSCNPVAASCVLWICVHAASDRVKAHLRIKKTKSEWLGLDLWPIAMGLGCRHDTKQLNSAGKMFSCCLYSCHLSPASAPPTESPPMPLFLASRSGVNWHFYWKLRHFWLIMFFGQIHFQSKSWGI